MRKKRILIVLALIAIIAFGSGSYVLALNNQALAVSEENKNDLYKKCLESMPNDAGELESWHNSPEHQKLHENMMVNNPDMRTMHKQMTDNMVGMQNMHTEHHGTQT